ncbi:MAG: hypothetical protein D6732_20060 [Methanobacteriota archaeon]|nr:MAG: hypothetical protein D6732_20060 [Euryarchaeota archaeon]
MNNNTVAGILIAIIFVNTLIIGAYLSKIQETGNAVVGTVSLTILPSDECAITLNKSWNFISLCKNNTDLDINSALAGADFQFVLEWDETTQSYKVFSPLSQNNPFTQFDPTKSYFIYIRNGSYLYLPSGTPYSDIDLFLPPQWSVPFYPYEFQGNVSTYLSTLGTNWKFQLKWDYPTQSFKVRSRLSSNPPFTAINAGEGQFLYLTSADTLAYNKTEVTT